MTRYTTPKLIELALQYAIEERAYFMECTLKGEEPYERARELVEGWKAILAKRYGRRAHTDVLAEEMAKATSVPISELMAAKARTFVPPEGSAQ